jgi:U2 small nuclear ribonucleoprotein B''
LRRDDPNFVPPNFAHASSAKRVREAEESELRSKRERAGDEDGEEMDIDDDDEADPAPSTSNSMYILSYRVILKTFPNPSIQHKRNLPTSYHVQTSHKKLPMASSRCYSNSTWRCVNLPYKSSNKNFRYRGFQTAQVKPSPKPNAAGEKVKTAEVVFENAQLAAAARQMLDGFQLKKGWNMAVGFLP